MDRTDARLSEPSRRTFDEIASQQVLEDFLGFAPGLRRHLAVTPP